jgi:hypothetical protein
MVGREWGLRTVPGGHAVLGAVLGRGRFGVPVRRCCDRVVAVCMSKFMVLFKWLGMLYAFFWVIPGV